jgi:hypothetical protein
LTSYLQLIGRYSLLQAHVFLISGLKPDHLGTWGDEVTRLYPFLLPYFPDSSVLASWIETLAIASHQLQQNSPRNSFVHPTAPQNAEQSAQNVRVSQFASQQSRRSPHQTSNIAHLSSAFLFLNFSRDLRVPACAAIWRRVSTRRNIGAAGPTRRVASLGLLYVFLMLPS